MSIYDQAQVFGPKLIDTFKNPIKATHQRNVKVSDGQGGFDISWTDLKQIDIAILPKSGKDNLASERVENKVMTIAYVKYDDISDFANGDRLEHDGKIYRIDASFDIAKAKAVIKFMGEDGAAT